ncbi:MAG: MlaD family protein [Ignavibacteriaceae bacterium]
MKDQRKTEIKVGIMVIAGILIFIWVLSWAKNFSFTSTEKNLYVKFSSVSGLEIGDYVTVNGVRKGFVEDYNVHGDSVIVKLSINNDVVLKEDAVFSVAMLDLMGGKKVEIHPGISSRVINYNRVQSGIYYADIPTVMAMIGTVQDDLVSTIKDVGITLKSLNNYLTDEQLNRDVKTSLSNLSDLSQKINVLIDENQNSIRTLTKNTAELTEEAREFISANREGINTSVNDLQIILKRTDTLLTRINTFAEQITNEDNNLNKMLNDKEMHNNLTESLKQLKDLTKILLEQLQNEGIKIDANIDLF